MKFSNYFYFGKFGASVVLSKRTYWIDEFTNEIVKLRVFDVNCRSEPLLVCWCCCCCLDINPSSWRQGDALMRRLLGPVKHVKQSHSPPTRDVLKHDTCPDGQSRMFADTQSILAAGSLVPSSVHGSDEVPGELDRSSVNIHEEASMNIHQDATVNIHEKAAAALPVERLLVDMVEVVDSKPSADAAATQNQPLPDATNCCDLNIQELTVHSISIKAPGYFLFVATCLHSGRLTYCCVDLLACQ